MASGKEIRTQISSVQNTQKITRAMEMVAASKMRKAQDRMAASRPYADKMRAVINHLAFAHSEYKHSYLEERDVKRVGYIIVSSDRGLCGGFNSNITKKAIEVANTKYAQQLQLGNLDFMCIGKQGARQLKHRGYKVVADENELFDNLSFENVSGVAEECMKSFSDKHYDRIELVYNQFKNAAVQIQAAEQFLPVEMEEGAEESNFDFIYEPSKEHIIEELIPRSLKIQFYKALLDSNAAEHGARMTAMHQATDNATDLIGSLTLEYNKARQASITGEILEIVSGAEALNG